MPVKIVHAADFHLENSFAGMSPEHAALRRKELKNSFLQVIQLADNEQAQILLLAGDLFEHERAGRELMHFLDQAFSKLKAKVFIAPGNHDPGLPNSPYWSYSWSSNVHIFREQFEAVPLPQLGCVVYGLGFAHYAIKEPLLRGVRVAQKEVINLVVMHGEDRSSPIATGISNYLPFTVDELAMVGADYYALGHHHRPRVVWEENGSCRACYAGSPEPLGFDEEGEHGVFCGTVDKHANTVRFIKLNQRSYQTVSLVCSGEEFLAQLADLAVRRVPEEQRLRDCIRLVFGGEVDPGLEFDRLRLETALAPHFFHCRVENASVPRYDLEVFDHSTVRGKFARKLTRLLEQAENEEDRDLLRKTLYFGLDALSLGKVVER